MTKNNLGAIFQYRWFLANLYCCSLHKIKPRFYNISNMNHFSGGSDYAHFTSLFNSVNIIASDNADFFCGKTSNRNVEFSKSFDRILNVLNPLQISLEVITRSCENFDISPSCKGNGYRSIANVVESCLNKVLELNEQIKSEREKFFFRSYHTYMELDSYSHVLMRLLSIVQFAIILLEESDYGCLFPKEEKIDESVMADFEKINRECFYGRSFGFQYVESLKKPLRFVGVVMAAYADGFSRHDHSLSRALSSVIHSGKYYINPELRAKRITELTQKSNVSFCKAFWSLTESYGVQHAPLLLCPAMAVNTEFSISNDPINIKTLDNNVIEVVLPPFNGKVLNVRARLLSYVWREGQVHEVNNKSIPMLGAKPSPPSRYLMFHAHGGGFVAQSSKSHEIYLRYWAKTLNIPILSIDYSLSPGAPFPQALNEIYFAYAWALQNLDKLGCTGEKIVFAGDSAGANLVTAVALKVIEGNFRLPDSIVLAYPPLRLQYLPSPSRILSLMDPLLPIGVLKTCISAYSGDVIKNSYELVNSSFYRDETFNPYDLDIGDTFDECNMRYRRSFSENDMIKLKHPIKNDLDDNDRFYSDFPYSDSSSTSNEFSLVDNFSLSDNTIDENKTPSLLRSFTSSFSSRVKLMTLNMATYLYGTDNAESKFVDQSDGSTNLSKSKKKKEEFEALKNEPIKNYACDSSINLMPLESPKITKSFSICKECLHRSENCICQHLIPKVRLKKTAYKYRASHHYRDRSLSCCNEEKLNSKLNNLSHSVTSLQEENFFDEDAKTELLSQSENFCGLEMRPCENDEFSNAIPISLTHLQNSLNPHVHSSFMNSTNVSFELGKNHYLSPFLASDSLLKRLPTVIIVASALDPLFDDSVEFIRKMKSLNKTAELCIVDKLPHGFLNFQAFSNEAKEASDLIIACVKKSLNMGIRVNDSSINLKFDGKK